MAAILKNRYNVISLPPIVRLRQNWSGCKITWWLQTSQNRTGSRIPIWRPSIFWNRK